MTNTTDTISPADPRFWSGDRDRYAQFAALRAQGPVLWHDEPSTEWFPDGGRGFWSVTRYDDVVTVSRDQDTFTSGLGTEIVDMPADMVHIFGGMLNMSGAEHTRHRAIVNRVLTPRSVEALSDTIRAHAVRSIERVRGRGECDFMADIVGDFPAQVICELLGVPVADRDRLIELTGVALVQYGTATAYEAMLEIIAYAEDLTAKARTNAEDSAAFLQKLLGAKIDGEGMTDHEIAVFFALLVTAGIETTATSIGHGLYALSQYPDARRKWQENFHELAPRAIEEIVRWVSPVMHFRRTATRDTEVAGQKIARGDKVVIWYLSANRDDAVFERPDELDFDRPEQPHVAFGGGGPHFCLGAILARKEMNIFYEELFNRLPDITVAGDPVRLHSNFVNGIASLPVTFTPA
ncbi:cytochrome P450 [Rhodococcus koreensis]|uniref:cytochrome P450 n=1 Tax=Rhodococcus koreensis TaxID=99653 RepID=UPI003672CCE8